MELKIEKLEKDLDAAHEVIKKSTERNREHSFDA